MLFKICNSNLVLVPPTWSKGWYPYICWVIYLFYELTEIVLLVCFSLQYVYSYNQDQKFIFVLNFQRSYFMVISLSSKILYSWWWFWGYYSEIILFLFHSQLYLYTLFFSSLGYSHNFLDIEAFDFILYLVSMNFLSYSSSIYFPGSIWSKIIIWTSSVI